MIHQLTHQSTLCDLSCCYFQYLENYFNKTECFPPIYYHKKHQENTLNSTSIVLALIVHVTAVSVLFIQISRWGGLQCHDAHTLFHKNQSTGFYNADVHN